MKRKVYISGAIAHCDLEERMAAFDHAARYLALKGCEPVNPFDNGVPQDAHWTEHMRTDIGLLLECDCIYMLQGWELSKGAKLELDVASSCGIRVMFEGQDNDVREYTCCICGKRHTGYGNNPYPLKENGECCPECNVKVLAERVRLSGHKDKQGTWNRK